MNNSPFVMNQQPKARMKYLLLIALTTAACSAQYNSPVSSYVGDVTHNHAVSLQNTQYKDCYNTVTEFAEESTDMYEEHMDSCVFHDADYLNVPFEVGEEQ